MAKIFVDVKTPGNGKAYEFQLDDTMSIEQVKARMIYEITEIENGNIALNSEKVMLHNLNTRMHLSDTDTVRDAGVKSGQSLMLI